MKYTIVINQKAAVELGAGLDITDMAVFDYIRDFANSASCVKIMDGGKTYFWISSSKIIADMPLLGIASARNIRRKVDNLVRAGVLCRHEDCEKLGKSLYTFGDNYEALLFETSREDRGQNCPTPDKNVHPPRTDLSTDYTINDNSNNNIYTANGEDSSPQQEQEPSFEEFWEAYNYKKDKQNARKAWLRLSTKEKELAICSAAAYRADCVAHNRSMMFPQGYLSHKRWEDDFSAQQQGCHPQAPTAAVSQNLVTDTYSGKPIFGLTTEAWEEARRRIATELPLAAPVLTKDPAMYMRMMQKCGHDHNLLVKVLRTFPPEENSAYFFDAKFQQRLNELNGW